MFVAGAAVLTLGLVAWAVVNLARMGPSASLEWWRQAWPHARTPAIFHRAISVALVIGTLLTLINQGDVILAGEIPSFGKMLLTYCVPYFVNTHGAVSARIKA